MADDSILVVHTDASHIDKVVGALDTLDLRPWDVSVGAADQTGRGSWLTVRARDVANRDSVEAELGERLNGFADVERNWKSVSLVARNLADSAGTLDQAVAALPDAAGLLVRHTTRITHLLPDADRARQVAERWHALLLESLAR